MGILSSAIVTVLVTRVVGFFAIYYFPSIYFDSFYHLYYGLALLVLVLLFKYFFKKTKFIFFGIALGLIFDDIAVLQNFFTGSPANPITTYWSGIYVIPLFSGLTLMSLFEEKLKQIIR